jgi:hypothetical protein
LVTCRGKVVREAADRAGGATAVRERRRSAVTWVRKKSRKEACAWVGVTHSA